MKITHFVFSAIFMLGIVGVSLNRLHLLSALLCLEAMMLSLFMALAFWALELMSGNLSTAPLLLLAFSACEASAGLSILVATSRTHGTDRMTNLSILKW
uniref:NADH-ubiquinone oxidoreductase chain 4L n=1 Tax=Lythrypnus sp. AC-2023 TaxID=3028465 RepID=A0AA95Z6K2_9GOBI|nr:NADH dehydrogenase subunit 4L [Lythrypnus sp. AC-2023]